MQEHKHSIQDHSYSWVYAKLVKDETDLVGAIAYVLYKQQKIQCIRKFEDERTDQGLSLEESRVTEQELTYINKLLSNDEAIRGYLERAEILVSNFLKKALEKDITRIESEAEKRTYSELQKITDGIESKVDNLAKDKTWKDRFSEAFLSIVYSLFVIALLGAAVKGITWVADSGSRIQSIFK